MGTARSAEKKALDLTVLDLRGVATFTDYFIISTGANKRQMQAIADELLISEAARLTGAARRRLSGASGFWGLRRFIVHVFDEKSRRFYDLSISGVKRSA